MSEPQVPVGPNRRRIDRHRLGRNPQVQYLIKPSFQSHQAAIYDVSLGGIGLVQSRIHEPETVLAILMRSLTANKSWIEVARVRHVTQIADGSCLLGCLFVRDLGQGEVACLIDDEFFACAEDEVMTFSDNEMFTLILGPEVPRS
jgi:hypothetical protein